MSVAQTTFPLGLILTHSSDSVFAFWLEVSFMPGLESGPVILAFGLQDGPH